MQGRSNDMPGEQVQQQLLLPTLRELREALGMGYVELAQASGVRPSVVYWAEQGILVERGDVVRILRVFSKWTGFSYTSEYMRGLRLKQKEG